MTKETEDGGKKSKLKILGDAANKAFRELFSLPYTIDEVSTIIKDLEEVEEEHSYADLLLNTPGKTISHDEKTFERKGEIIEDFCRNIRRLQRTMKSRSKNTKLPEELRKKIGEDEARIDDIFWKEISGKSMRDHMGERIVITNEAGLVKSLGDIREILQNLVDRMTQK